MQVKKRDLMMGLLALSLGAFSAVSQAQVIVRVAPPPPRAEVIPAPRHGMVWVNGYWDWNGHRYVWRQGHYVQARAGHRWREDRWVQREGGWVREHGGWDRDHDGVPNRFDARPHDPYRR
jgi:hypothetical protein